MKRFISIILVLLILVGCATKDKTDNNSSIPDELKNLDELTLWGVNPGLGVDILHEHGFTGEGINIAYIDQALFEPLHEEFNEDKIIYTNLSSSSSSMHGPSVLSLLAGKNIGVVPDATVYYYGHSANYLDQKTHAEALYQLIEDNKKLPDDKKITMVGFSDNIDPEENNIEAFEKATQDCLDAGIMVWFCGEYGGTYTTEFSNKDNPNNMVVEKWYDTYYDVDLCYVPSASRTTIDPTHTNNKEDASSYYYFWNEGGLSWAMPYMLGLYGIVKNIDPSLTQDDIRKLVKDTNTTNIMGLNIVSPIEMVATTLDNVGRKDEAKSLRDEYYGKLDCLYVLINLSSLSNEDIISIEKYLSSIEDYYVKIINTENCIDAGDIYNLIKKDSDKNYRKIAGIQIIGNANIVPAFEIKYKALMKDGIDEMGTYLSDYFYGNLNNNVDDLLSYSVYDQFENNLNVDLNTNYPVIRLPLKSGEFNNFINNYYDFVSDINYKKLKLVNMSNPIFHDKNHIDDMGEFLNRLHDDELIDDNYVLYGNQKGVFPVTTEVKGDFTNENMKNELDVEPIEFVINTHGQENNIDRTFVEKSEEIRESMINSDNINDILNTNPYYLDLWTCNNATSMSNCLVTTALNGKCVGAFAATTVLSNNGVKNKASYEDMKKSNFYYFYYNYLKSINEGCSRSQSFYIAQKEYASALLEDSKNPIRGEGNYQFNLNNLLCYGNFGLFECNSVLFEKTINSEDIPKHVDAILQSYETYDENEIDNKNKKQIKFYLNENLLSKSTVEVNDMYYYEKGTNTYHIVIDLVASPGMSITIFVPPGGDDLNIVNKGKATDGTNQKIILKVSKEKFDMKNSFVMYIGKNDDDRCFYMINK